jgi:hypothetical protein
LNDRLSTQVSGSLQSLIRTRISLVPDRLQRFAFCLSCTNLHAGGRNSRNELATLNDRSAQFGTPPASVATRRRAVTTAPVNGR